MKFEWFGSFNKRREKAPDHTTDSILPLTAHYLQWVGWDEKKYSVYKDSEGRKFYTVPRHGADQMFAARLMKGIVAVSDVLYDKKKGKYLSYEVPLKDVAPNNDSARSSKILLEWLFGDIDHRDANVRYKDKAHAFYDFEYVSWYFWDTGTMASYKDHVRSAIWALTPEGKKAFRTALGQLQERFEGEEGEDFVTKVAKSILEYTGELPLTFVKDADNMQIDVQKFLAEMRRRLAIMRAELDSIERPASPAGSDDGPPLKQVA